MKNVDSWAPTKFVQRRGQLVASHDPAHVGIGSQLVTNLVAAQYGENLKRFAQGRLIDLGCGQVPLFAAYSPYVTDITCVDWHNSLAPSAFLDHMCDISDSLPFHTGEFDTIVLSDVLEHIPRPEQLWHEMFRILATGGKLIMNVPFYYWLHGTPYDYYRYTEFALRRFADVSGFKVLVLSPVGGVAEVLTDIVAKVLAKVPFGGRSLSSGIQEAVRIIGSTGRGQSLRAKTGVLFPLGYFLVAEKP